MRIEQYSIGDHLNLKELYKKMAYNKLDFSKTTAEWDNTRTKPGVKNDSVIFGIISESSI